MHGFWLARVLNLYFFLFSPKTDKHHGSGKFNVAFFSTTSSQIILTSKNCHNHIPPRPNPFYSDYHVTRLTNNTATNMSAYQDYANPFYGSDYQVTLLTNEWRTQGRGPGGPGPPLIFRPNWGPKGRKNFGGGGGGGGPPPPPPPFPPYLKIWIRHCQQYCY